MTQPDMILYIYAKGVSVPHQLENQKGGVIWLRSHLPFIIEWVLHRTDLLLYPMA